MRGQHFIASVIFAGSICAAADITHAATVPLPAGHATFYLTGEIPNPFWMTFSLDAQIQLLPGQLGDPNSRYILNLSLSNGLETTAVQFAKIEGIDVDNGLYGPEGPPRLLFSNTVRTLHVHPDSDFFNALLVDATLYATLPDGLSFTSELPVGSAVELAETPLPGAAPLFVSGIGGIGFLTWRRLRKQQLNRSDARAV